MAVYVADNFSLWLKSVDSQEHDEQFWATVTKASAFACKWPVKQFAPFSQILSDAAIASAEDLVGATKQVC